MAGKRAIVVTFIMAFVLCCCLQNSLSGPNRGGSGQREDIISRGYKIITVKPVAVNEDVRQNGITVNPKSESTSVNIQNP